MRTTNLPQASSIYIPSIFDIAQFWDDKLLTLAGGITRTKVKGSWKSPDGVISEDITILTVYSSLEASGYVSNVFHDIARSLFHVGEKSVLIKINGVAELLEP